MTNEARQIHKNVAAANARDNARQAKAQREAVKRVERAAAYLRAEAKFDATHCSYCGAYVRPERRAIYDGTGASIFCSRCDNEVNHGEVA